jgi:hypothetical protein
MKTAVVAAAAAGLLLWSGPAGAARTADYSVPEDRFAELADSLAASGFRPMPARGEVDVVLENAEAADHRLAILGISCRAWHVDNPLSQMVRQSLTAWDKDGDLAAAAASANAIRLRLDSASSTMRCVQVKELKMRCLVTMSLGATATRTLGGAEQVSRIAIDLRQEQKMSGACNGLAQGSSLIGRAASIALIDRLTAIAAEQ